MKTLHLNRVDPPPAPLDPRLIKRHPLKKSPSYLKRIYVQRTIDFKKEKGCSCAKRMPRIRLKYYIINKDKALDQ